MRRYLSHSLRLVTVAAVGGSASLAALAVSAVPASAVVQPPTCAKAALSLSHLNINLSQCTDASNTGGAGSFVETSLLGGPLKITWGGGHGTTSITLSSRTPLGGCPIATSGVQIKGKVTADTGKAKSVPVGSSVSADICPRGSPAGAFLKAGTKFVL